jgi:hypothetical protein
MAVSTEVRGVVSRRNGTVVRKISIFVKNCSLYVILFKVLGHSLGSALYGIFPVKLVQNPFVLQVV